MRRRLFVVAGWLMLWPAARGPAVAQERVPFPEALVAWTQEPATALFVGAGEPAWDAKIRERGWILQVEDGYRLYYTGYREGRETTRMLGLATSKDGLTWDRHPANPLVSDTWVEDVCVVRDGDLYQMFAEGRGDVAHRLTSADGLAWEEVGPLDVRRADGTPIEPGPFGTPTAWKEGATWYLFYERGDQGVWLATSDDLATWTNVRDQPVLAMGPEPYDRTAVALNQIIRDGDWYIGVYHANSERPWRDWTTCLARSMDLVHWEKYAGNPIVRNNSSSGMFVGEGSGRRLYTMHPEVRRYEPAGVGPRP